MEYVWNIVYHEISVIKYVSPDVVADYCCHLFYYRFYFVVGKLAPCVLCGIIDKYGIRIDRRIIVAIFQQMATIADVEFHSLHAFYIDIKCWKAENECLVHIEEITAVCSVLIQSNQIYVNGVWTIYNIDCRKPIAQNLNLIILSDCNNK